MLPLTGYADRFSVAPGQTIAFKVSSTAATPYQARLVRLISGDPNPAGPGIKEEPVPAPFARELSLARPAGAARLLPARAGRPGVPGGSRSFTLVATIWPTTARPGPPGHRGPPRSGTAGTGFALFVDARGAGALVGNGRGGGRDGRTSASPSWRGPGTASGRPTTRPRARSRSARRRSCRASGRTTPAHAAAVRRLRARARQRHAAARRGAMGGAPVGGHYNGKIERPRSTTPRWASRRTLAAPDGRRPPPGRGLGLRAATPRAPARSTWDRAGSHGELVNLPARAMMGSQLDGRGDVLAPRARAVRRHPLPRRRPLRLRLGDRLHLHRAGRAAGAASTRCGSRRATSRT